MPDNDALSLFQSAQSSEPDERADGALELFGESLNDDKKLRASLHRSTSLNPDQSARDRVLAEEYGVPVDTVRRNKTQYESRKEFDSYDFGTLKSETPRLSANLENPDIAPIIKDDIKELSYFERWRKDLGQASQKGKDTVTVTELGMKSFLADFGMGDPLSPSEELSLHRAGNREGQDYEIGFVPGIPGAVAEMAPLYLESIKDALPFGVTGGGAYAGGTLLAGQAGPQAAVPEELVTVPAAFVTGFGRSMSLAVPVQFGMAEMGGAYHEFSSMRDENGEPLEKGVAGGAALVVGLINGSLESVGFGKLAKNFPGADKVLGKLTTGQVKQMVRTTAGREFFKGLTKSVVTGAAVEGLTESLQEATNIILGEVAKSQSDLDFNVLGIDQNASEEEQIQQFNDFLSGALDRVGESGVRGAQGGAGFSAAGQTLSKGYDAARARLLREQEQEQISEIFVAAKESKTNQRDPKLFNKITSEMMEDESVYIDASKVQEFFQSGGDAEDLFENIPEAREQLENALEHGGDLILPTNKVAGYAARNESFAALQEWMRLSPEAITDQEFQDEYFNRILPEMEMLEDQGQAIEQGEVFQRNIKDQIMNAGFTPDTAEQYSTLLREAYETEIANAESNDATQIVERMFGNLSIQDGSRQQQRIIEPDDLLIDRARSLSRGERAAAKDDRQTLTDFIRSQGGVRNASEQSNQAGFFGTGGAIQEADSGSDNLIGDLEALDIDKDDRGRKVAKNKRVIREDGKFLDDLALAATEAGYYTERPDLTQFMADIEAETRGTAKLAETESAPEFQRDEEALRFAEQLEREGVDLDSDNETIKSDIKRLSGEEFFQSNPDSEAFKRWFGESQVVDDDGSPLVVHHGGFEAGKISIFDKGFGGQTTGNNEHGAFHFASEIDVAEDYARQSFNRRFQDDTDSLVSEGIVDDVPEFEDYEDAYAFVEELADDQAPKDVQSVYLKIENPVVIDMKGERVDVQQIEDISRAVIQGFDETGELENYWDRSEIFDPDDINDYRDEIEERARENYDLEPDDEIESYQFDDAVREVLWDENGIEPEINMPDGIIIKNMIDDIGDKSRIIADQFIVFEPNQIKSVKNNGSFDQYNNDIFYQGDDTKRGSIQFNGPTGESVINVFENRDLSTILHESGHFFLEVQRSLAEHSEASPERVERWNKLLNWMGVEDGSKIERKHHEKFAEAFEIYLEKGEAPSLELKDSFRRFKSWLINLWRRLPQLKPDLTVPKEIQDIFDRMLATDDKIEQMRSMPIFRPDPNVLSLLNEQEKKQYIKRSEDAVKESKENLLKKALKEKTREEKKWWKDESLKVSEEVEERIKQMPVYKAHDLLAKGIVRTPEGETQAKEPIKLSRKVIKDQFDEEYIKYLPRGTTQRSGGVSPALIAEQFGFESGDDLLRSLSNLKPMKEAVAEQTQATMFARHGDLLNDGTLEREALQSMQGDKKGDVLSSELSWVSRYTGKQYPGKQGFKARARDILSEMTVDNAIKPSKYYYAEVKNARAAGKHLANKDFEKYAEAKSKQLLNHYLYSESNAAREKTDKALKRFNKYMKPPKKGAVRMDEDYRERIVGLLDKYNLGPRLSDAKRTRLEMAALNNWITAQNNGEDGVTLITPPELLEADNKTHYRDLTLNEFEAFSDLVDNIAAQGKNKRTLMLEGKKRDLDKDRLTVAEAILDKSNPTGHINSHKIDRDRKRLLKNVAGTLLTPDQLVKDLDGREDLGVVYEHIKAPIDRAVTDKLLPMRDDLAEKLDKLYDLLPKSTIVELKKSNTSKHLTKLYGVSSSGVKYNKEELLSIALNWGNESNRDAIIEGLKKSGISEQAIEEHIFSNLSKPEWDFVQATWDLFNEYWPETAKLEKQRTGFAPEKIDSSPIETPHGVYRGGYYPLKYDSNQSLWVSEETIEEKIKDMRAGRFGRAATKRGRTIERVGSGGRPVILELSVITSELSETVQDLAMGEAVSYVDSILNSEQVKNALTDSGNIEYARALDIWLKDTAVGEIVSADFVSKLFRKTRTNFTVSVLAANVGTGLLQPLGYFTTLAELGGKYAGVGLKKIFTSPWMGDGNVFEQVNNASNFMVERQKTFNKDIWDAQRKAAGRITDLPANLTKAFFWHIAKAQQIVDTATWLGAYQKGLDQYGTEEKALAFADRTVARTQSSGIFSDRTAIERGTISNNIRQTELVRVWTTLISYFIAKSSVAYNKTGDTNFKDINQVMKWSMDMTLLFFVEGAIVAAMRNQWPDDDDEQSKFMFGLGLVRSNVLAGIPFAREAESELGGFRGGSAMSALYERFGKASEQINQGEFDKALVKNMNSLGGILIGYPSSATNKVIGYLWDKSEGEDVSVTDALIYREKD